MSNSVSLRCKIDIGHLGEILRADKDVIDVEEWNGKKHRVVKVSIMERREPKNKSTHYMKVDMYHKQEIQGVNYFLGDCYPINFGGGNNAQAANAPAQQQNEPQPQDNGDDIPF